MPDRKLATYHCDQIPEICTVAHISQQRLILLINRLPVSAVHLRIVEILPLNAPRLFVDLGPLSSRIDTRLELRNVERAVTNFCWPFRGNNPPTICTVPSLI